MWNLRRVENKYSVIAVRQWNYTGWERTKEQYEGCSSHRITLSLRSNAER